MCGNRIENTSVLLFFSRETTIVNAALQATDLLRKVDPNSKNQLDTNIVVGHLNEMALAYAAGPKNQLIPG